MGSAFETRMTLGLTPKAREYSEHPLQRSIFPSALMPLVSSGLSFCTTQRGNTSILGNPSILVMQQDVAGTLH